MHFFKPKYYGTFLAEDTFFDPAAHQLLHPSSDPMLTQLATVRPNVSCAAVCLFNKDSQYVITQASLKHCNTAITRNLQTRMVASPRSSSRRSTHELERHDLLLLVSVVADLTKDARFADRRFDKKGRSQGRFYAGVPICAQHWRAFCL